MASISKLSNALVSMPNELTVAAANFNLDFSLMKVEAPKEFHGLRDALSSHRRSEAEEGQPHITARRLGSLFESILPPIPKLIQAYGKRVSEISNSTTATQKPPNLGIFTAHAGLDGTSIWAAATSGQSAVAIHLLACILARMWKSHEATSLWVELVEQRKQEIKHGYQTTNAAETASIMAAQQIFYRQQLAAWDSSARAWLQTADSNRKNQQTQLMLIINNVQIPVSTKKDAYGSIMEAWKMGLCAMERLVQGLPQLVQNGAVLLAISAWHLYPNMEVLSDQTISINQHDELMNGALLTIPTHSLSSHDEGIFWSLPLARMRYYSPPIEVARRLASDTSRVSMEDFWIVVLGSVISQWGTVSKNIKTCCDFIIETYEVADHPAFNDWLKFLADASRRYVTAKEMYRRQCDKLLRLGMRWCKSFLNSPDCTPPPLFGLDRFEVLLSMIPTVEQKISILRNIAQTLRIQGQDLLLRYPNSTTRSTYRQLDNTSPRFRYASAILPEEVSHVCRVDDAPAVKRQRHDLTTKHFRWITDIRTPVDPEITCDGSICGCTVPNGPNCPCAEEYQECSQYCHADWGRCGSNALLKDPCPSDCLGEARCARCYLRHQIRCAEERNEDCILIHRDDIRKVDQFQFLVQRAQEEDSIFEFVLGDVKDVAIFKKVRVPINREFSHISGSPASCKEISDILPLIEQKALVDYLRTWWCKTSMGSTHQQETSMRALVFATNIYEFLDGAMVSIETIKKPLYEASWASWAQVDIVLDPPQSPKEIRSTPRQYSQNEPASRLSASRSNSVIVPPGTPGPNSVFDKDFEYFLSTHLSPRIDSHRDFTMFGRGEKMMEDRDIHKQTHTLLRDHVSTGKLGVRVEDKIHDKREGEQHPKLGGHNAHVIRRDRESFSAASFACIAALESGECDVDLRSLRGVMALSMGDSIFVLSALISDPSKEAEGHVIRRVFGNLGRPEIAFLVPPSKPRLKDYDPKSWHLIDHLPFDGNFESKFDGTSLHLSFTDFEMPVDVGSRGLRDTLVILLESLISINDRGKHLGDIDVLSLFRSRSLTIKNECVHPSQEDGVTKLETMPSQHEDLISIDSWDEFFDFPETTVIVRANGNWQARLAIASASTIQGKRTLILPEPPCLRCLEECCGEGSYDVIVA